MIWNYLVSTYITDQIDRKTIYSFGPRLKAFSDWLLQVIASGNLESMIPAAACEYGPYVEELWRDGAFQATYNRRNELKMLPRVATYFLERVKHALCPCFLLFLQFLDYVFYYFVCVCVCVQTLIQNIKLSDGYELFVLLCTAGIHVTWWGDEIEAILSIIWIILEH